MEDKKKVARMLVLGLKKKPEEEPAMDDSMDEGSDEEPDSHVAAKEVMDALKSDDVGAFSEALKSFIQLCDYPEDSSEEGM